MHDGTTPLILAARLAVEGMVDELINCHADVNAIDDFGKRVCPLVRAINEDSDEFLVQCLTRTTCVWPS